MSKIQGDNLGAARDEFYADLMAAHDGLTTAESHALNVRLVLLMANEIGDVDALRTVITTARSYTGTK